MRHTRPDSSYLPGLTKHLSFVDEAGHAIDPNQHFLCLAGLLATEAAWGEFEIEWREACAAAGLRAPFHMMHFAARKEQFANWPEERRIELLAHLVGTIVRAEAMPIGSVVSLDGYRALSPKEKAKFKDPHFVAFQTLTFQLAVAAEMANQPGPVTMVYAHHPEHSRGRGGTRQLWEALRKCNPTVSLFMEDYICSVQADEPGLQAADLWAYELRHHFEKIRPAGREPRWAFKQFVKLGLNYDFTHDFITYHTEHGPTGLGRWSRVTRLGEINLYSPGFVGLHPTKARELDLALRKFTAEILGRGDLKRGATLLKEMESDLSAH
jgi:Protein of unknown function (DUF3800)